MSIGKKVKQYRESKGLSQMDLAINADVAQTTISGLESDKSVPSSRILFRISEVLGVDINELLKDEIGIVNQIYFPCGRHTDG